MLTGPWASSFKPMTNGGGKDRKSTRLNSSHLVISYAVFCLKKKNQHNVERDAQSVYHEIHSTCIDEYPFFRGSYCDRICHIIRMGPRLPSELPNYSCQSLR